MAGTIEFLQSSNIATCVFNAFLSYNAIMLNIVTIHAIRKTSSLPKPLKTLLLSLAVSDLGVGLLVQPLYIAFHATCLKQNIENNVAVDIIVDAYHITLYLLISASFFSVMVISADRFLAIHLHLRYQELVTHGRVVVTVILIWVFSAFLSTARLWMPKNIIRVSFAIIYFGCLLTSVFLNCKIFQAVRRHAHQIQVQEQQVAQNKEVLNTERMRKSAVATGCIYLVLLVCYLPDSCVFWIIVFNSSVTSQPLLHAIRHFTVTLLFLKSSLNPVIYCWKMRNIRHKVIAILRKTC